MGKIRKGEVQVGHGAFAAVRVADFRKPRLDARVLFGPCLALLRFQETIFPVTDNVALLVLFVIVYSITEVAHLFGLVIRITRLRIVVCNTIW